MFKKLFLDSKGNYTLEATVVLPIILLILFGLVFLSMYIYQRFALLDAAVYTATQRAATWDNSYKKMEDGSLGGFQNDGLYWRVFKDFSGAELVEKKITDAHSDVDAKLKYGVLKRQSQNVTVNYQNYFVKRNVSVEINQSIFMPFNWLSNILGTNVSTKVNADVAEPVEYIRTVDLVAEYGKKISEKLDVFGRIKTTLLSWFDKVKD